MKTIRSNTFETNSSSTHSITIDTVNYKNKQIPQEITIPCGEFGWEFKKFNDFLTKASYFLTLSQNNEHLKSRMVRLSQKYEFNLEMPAEKDFVYVDHGSEHYDSWIREYPQIDTDDGLWEFLTHESCWIILGNDNQADPPNWRQTPKQEKNLNYKIYFINEDFEDNFDYMKFSMAVEKPTIEENKENFRELLYYILDSEHENYDDPYGNFKDVNDEGNIVIEYSVYDYKARETKIVKTKTLKCCIYER